MGSGGKGEAMKTRDLEKLVLAKGAGKVGEGGAHTRWVSAKGYPFTIPRHREIPPGTARAILKQADM